MSIYFATINVEAIEDNYEQGEIGKYKNIATFPFDDFESDTLIEMFTKIRKFLNINTEQEFLNGLCAFDNESTTLIFTRNETINQTIPTENEIELWKKNQFKLYAVYYYITIEKRIIESVTAKDVAKVIGKFNIN